MSVRGVLAVVNDWPFLVSVALPFFIFCGWFGKKVALRALHGFKYDASWKRELAETFGALLLGLFVAQYLIWMLPR